MNPLSRKERICCISAILTGSPNKLYSLSYFGEMFGSAKSTLSEDVSIMKDAFAKMDMGEIDVVIGAGGGVRFHPSADGASMRNIMEEIRSELEKPSRILPGGFIYTADIMLTPKYVDMMAKTLWNAFKKTSPDFIITVETKGIPLAMAVARLFGVRLVVARRENKLTEGSVVTLNYLSGASKRLQTMSLSKRAAHEGQKALVIDDFLAGGGTVKAVFELMKEFTVTVVGCGVAIATETPKLKKIDNYKSIFTLEEVDEEAEKVSVSVSLIQKNDKEEDL